MLRFFICQILLNHPRAKLTILVFKKGSEFSRLSKIGKYNITVSSNFQSARNALETVWQEYEKRTAYLEGQTEIDNIYDLTGRPEAMSRSLLFVMKLPRFV